MARLLASHKIEADVFVSIPPGPMQILKDAGQIDEAVPVASISMVVAYSPEDNMRRSLNRPAGR